MDVIKHSSSMKEDGDMQQVLNLGQKEFIGHNLINFMNRNQVNTTELGHALGFTQSMISKIRTDKAPVHFDDLPKLFEATEGFIGEDEFKISILNQFTNGFIPPLPNYYFVSTELTSLATRVMAEMRQSMNALNDALDDFSDPSSPQSLKNIRDPEQAFKQLYDVLRYTLPLMAFITNAYQLSWIDEAKDREKEIAKSNEHQI